MPSSTTRMLAPIAVLLLSCAAGRTVTVNGQQVPVEEAARADFAKAKQLFDTQKWQPAAAAFADFVGRYPDSAESDEARLRRGEALSRGGQLLAAQNALQDFLEQRPTSSFKNEAALELSLVQARLGKAPTVTPNVEAMSPQEKEQAASSLSQVLTQNGQPGEGARWAAKAYEGASEAEREQKKQDYENALAAASAPDLARLVADLNRSSPAWPPAALRLARIQLHVGQRQNASQLAADILSQPGAGEFADGARAVQQAIQASANVKPTLLGVVLPLTGDPVLKGFADQVLNAIALTVDLQNKGALQVSVKDSRGEPDAAAAAVDELAREGAIAILGPIGLAEGPAAAARAQQLGIPMVSLSRAEGLTAFGDFIFRDMPTSAAQAKAVAEYAVKKLNAKTFGILQPDAPYGDEMAQHFWDALEAQGAEVRAFERYPLPTTTFKPFVQRMVGRSPDDLAARREFAEDAEKIANEIKDPYRRRKALAQLKTQQAPVVDFDALFIPDSARKIRLLAPAIAAEDVITAGCDTKELEVVKHTTKNDALRTVQLLGISLWDSPDLVDERSGVARYVQCSIFVDSFYAQSDRPATRKFVDDYSSAYHHAPGFLEAHAFDAASLLKKAIAERHPGTREELRDALASMKKPLEGAAGDTVFGKDREAQKPFFWLWINRGSIQEFSPDDPPPVPPAGADVPGK